MEGHRPSTPPPLLPNLAVLCFSQVPTQEIHPIQDKLNDFVVRLIGCHRCYYSKGTNYLQQSCQIACDPSEYISNEVHSSSLNVF